MTALEVIRNRMNELGMDTDALAAETDYEVEIIRSSVDGSRTFKPNELVDVMVALDLDASTLKAASDGWHRQPWHRTK